MPATIMTANIRSFLSSLAFIYPSRRRPTIHGAARRTVHEKWIVLAGRGQNAARLRTGARPRSNDLDPLILDLPNDHRNVPCRRDRRLAHLLPAAEYGRMRWTAICGARTCQGATGDDRLTGPGAHFARARKNQASSVAIASDPGAIVGRFPDFANPRTALCYPLASSNALRTAAGPAAAGSVAATGDAPSTTAWPHEGDPLARNTAA